MNALPFHLSQGPLLTAISSNEVSRLQTFICDEDSEGLRLFHPSQKDGCDTGDWYGEHAGKWLVAASRAHQRTQSAEWAKRIAFVVSYLQEQQEPSGYLGTYSADSAARFTHPEASCTRTWDVWVHAWLILGLLDASKVPGAEHALPIAHKIGELLVDTFGGSGSKCGGKSVISQGNHQGLSSLVILEPLARLGRECGASDLIELAERTFAEANANGLPFLTAKDVTDIGTGKAYQIIWCLQGILALYETTGNEELFACVESLWTNIRDHHLTPAGGPWGGIATHKEVFNSPGFFDPSGLVETCSSATWMTLSQKLFLATNKLEYLVEVEKTLLNSILGAQDENGADWCYFSFPNGRRNNTYHWACCKSSGALALEFATAVVVTEGEDGVSINLLTSGMFTTSSGVEVAMKMVGEQLTLSASKVLAVRVLAPNKTWLHCEIGKEPLTINFEFPVRVVPHTHTVDHHGQEIVREDYACLTRGPYVYATEDKGQGTRLPRLNPESVFTVISDDEIELRQPGREPIKFVPYWLCGGRHHGAWRTTWLQVDWQ